MVLCVFGPKWCSLATAWQRFSTNDGIGDLLSTLLLGPRPLATDGLAPSSHAQVQHSSSPTGRSRRCSGGGRVDAPALACTGAAGVAARLRPWQPGTQTAGPAGRGLPISRPQGGKAVFPPQAHRSVHPHLARLLLLHPPQVVLDQALRRVAQLHPVAVPSVNVSVALTAPAVDPVRVTTTSVTAVPSSLTV